MPYAAAPNELSIPYLIGWTHCVQWFTNFHSVWFRSNNTQTQYERGVFSAQTIVRFTHNTQWPECIFNKIYLWSMWMHNIFGCSVCVFVCEWQPNTSKLHQYFACIELQLFHYLQHWTTTLYVETMDVIISHSLHQTRKWQWIKCLNFAPLNTK